MRPGYADTIKTIRTWSQKEKEIGGAVIIGSQVRSTRQADQWSDLYPMLVIHTPDTFLNDSQWVSRFGNVVCAYNEVTPLHFTSWDWCVKRVLSDDNRDVDFSILPYSHLDEALAINKGIIAKGYQVLYDEKAPTLETKIAALIATNDASSTPLPSEDELANTISDLLYHVAWAFKKILRRGLWVAA